jgi:hypothetical protein
LVPIEFCAIVGRDAVNDEKSYILLLDSHGNLVAEDVLLRLDIMDVGALDTVQRWPF